MSRKTCVVCLSPLPRRAREHGDPYCSTQCCRKAYGVQLREAPHKSRKPTNNFTLLGASDGAGKGRGRDAFLET